MTARDLNRRLAVLEGLESGAVTVWRQTAADLAE
jgi:hypothetical protein